MAMQPEQQMTRKIIWNKTAFGKKLNGALTSSMTLPGRIQRLSSYFSWYFPNRPLSYKGSEWNKPLPPNSPAIGKYVRQLV